MADNTISGASQLTNQAPPRRHAPADKLPQDGFRAGEPPLTGLVQPPVTYDPPAEAKGSTGKGIVIGVALTLVGLTGAALAPQLLDPTPPPLVQSQLTREQRGALNDLKSLDKIAHKYGGELQRKGLIFNRTATPERALQEMMSGDPIFYVHAKGATPLQVDNFEQLDQLQTHVQVQEVKHQIQDGIDQITGGLKEAGQAIGHELDEFWKEVRK